MAQKEHLKKLGEWVKLAREKANISQETAAEKAKMSRFQWIRIENGQSGTKRDTVIEIAKALKGDIAEALAAAGFLTENASQQPTPIIEAIAQSGHLQESDYELVAAMIKTLNEQRGKEKEKNE